jgi:hypothetical protein
MVTYTLLKLPFETASGSSGSQHTTSDKLSALPSDFQSTPVGRSATSLRMKSGVLGGSGLPSTSETRLPPSISRGAQPVPHSVSDSAVERETPPRQRVSFDSERGPSTSPRPSKYSFFAGSRMRIQGCCGQVFAAHIPIQRRAEPLKQAIILHANLFYRHRPSPVAVYQRTKYLWHSWNVSVGSSTRKRTRASTPRLAS